MSIDRKADADFQRAVVARDGECIFCGESDRSVLCAHHLDTRGLQPLRHDLRNGVTVCNRPRLRWIDGLGSQTTPCHILAESMRPFFTERAARYLVMIGYFKNVPAYYRFSGGARGGQKPAPAGGAPENGVE